MCNVKVSWTAKKLRKAFVEFFESKNHKKFPSSSVIPEEDKSLLFTNSGMVQFKKYFLDSTLCPESKRIVDIQHCIRAGGKHNDLDDVGKDNYHHTFFEMMGNWSFGDYFKEEAIDFAYEFLVDVLHIDPSRLYVSIYSELDKESRKLWSKYFKSAQIIEGDRKDNFWEMGEFGPCGPCTEIHYDRIGNRDASGLVNKNDPNVIEIWNIVFMEYEKKIMQNTNREGGFTNEMIPLYRKCIDTGIGMERLLSVLNGQMSNYLTETFQVIIAFIENLSNKKYTDSSENIIDVAFRVVSDHSRTLAICKYYGVGFSNEGAGYVVRRILRRALRYLVEILEIQPEKLIDIVRVAYIDSLDLPDVAIENFLEIQIEVNQFMKTLEKGHKQLKKMANTNQGKLSAEDVFHLYDTYGFPHDLTILMAEEEGIFVSLDGFDSIVENAKKVSKKGNDRFIAVEQFNFPKTVDRYKYSEEIIEAKLETILVDNVQSLNVIPCDKKFVMVFDRSNFYAEKGGQVGDRGVITISRMDLTSKVYVTDTQVFQGYVCHYCIVGDDVTEDIEIIGDETYQLAFDKELRFRCACNHSSEHIFSYFFKKNFPLCKRVGSFLDEDKIYYDYKNSDERLSTEDFIEVEKMVNVFINQNVERNYLFFESKDDLLKKNVNHFKSFDYPTPIRVVQFKGKDHTLLDACGGTHVENTESIRKVIVVSDTSKQLCVRRIELFSGVRAIEAETTALSLIKMLKNGEVVNFSNQTIPLRFKSTIERLNNQNKKTKLNLLSEELTKMSIEASQDILKIDKMNSDKEFIEFQLDKKFFDAPRKLVTKALNRVFDSLYIEAAKGIVYSECCDTKGILLRAFISDVSSEKLEEIKMKFRGLKLFKPNAITGTIPKEKIAEFISMIK